MNRLLLIAAVCTAQVLAAPEQKARVALLTDISSLTSAVREPDDGQSLIRYLLFSNEFDTEALVASSNMRHGQTVRPELIREAIDAYEKVWPNLKKHRADYPTPTSLRQLVAPGQPIAGPKVPVEDSVGEGKDTPASELLIQAADRRDSRPLWVLAWGGTADLAQALWKVRNTRNAAQTEAFVRKLRMHAIYDQDSTGAWIREQFPTLFYVLRNHGVRGMYRGGDRSLVSSDWVETHIRNNHGKLGALYPNYDGGDIWSGKLGRVRGIKEGDTPSYLGLIRNGLNDPERLDLGGWGGRFVRDKANPRLWLDAAEPDAAPEDPDSRMAAVYRWRPAFQSEMAARLDWCVHESNSVNQPPTAAIAGGGVHRLPRGTSIVLDGRKSKDGDGGGLRYEWQVYPHHPGVTVESLGDGRARLVAAHDVSPGSTVSVVLTVFDHGTPSLASYARAAIQIPAR
jgi:hypothetical protein